MTAFKSTLMGILIITVILHISLMCGVISVGTDSTAITLHESESIEDEDGAVDLDEDQEVLEIFQPTDEWQTIKEGQAIPAGLHVRINLATGLKEAKYLDKDDDSSQENHQEKVTMEDEKEGSKYKKDELEERLAKMDGDDECDNCEDNEALIEAVKERYRSLEELKKQFADLELDVKSDNEIMTELLDEYRQTPSNERRKLILQDLEFYVHKVDNGVDLETLGGWDIIIGALNSTEEDIRTEAAHVLGSAVQSNPKAQVSAFDAGAMQSLLHLLSQSPSVNAQKRALYGLSSLVRLFPFAQRKFLELGGLSVLSWLMRETGSDYLPIQIKSVTLIHDLIMEQINAQNLDANGGDQVAKERKLQYEKVHLITAVREGGWCDAVPMLLSVPDHDTREKILLSLNTLQMYCDFSTNLDLRHRLESLREEYSKMADAELGDGDDFFTSIYLAIQRLVSSL